MKNTLFIFLFLFLFNPQLKAGEFPSNQEQQLPAAWLLWFAYGMATSDNSTATTNETSTGLGISVKTWPEDSRLEAFGYLPDSSFLILDASDMYHDITVFDAHRIRFGFSMDMAMNEKWGLHTERLYLGYLVQEEITPLFRGFFHLALAYDRATLHLMDEEDYTHQAPNYRIDEGLGPGGALGVKYWMGSFDLGVQVISFRREVNFGDFTPDGPMIGVGSTQLHFIMEWPI